jgi:hypothetical protein
VEVELSLESEGVASVVVTGGEVEGSVSCLATTG